MFICESRRSQDGGESVYSYFSQTSNAGIQRHDTHRDHGTVEAGSQTVNSNGNGSASHRYEFDTKHRLIFYSIFLI